MRLNNAEEMLSWGIGIVFGLCLAGSQVPLDLLNGVAW